MVERFSVGPGIGFNQLDGEFGMKCEKIKKSINRYADGEEVNEKIIRHIESCESCTKESRQISRIKELAGSLPVYPVNPFLWTRISAALEKQPVIPYGVGALKLWVATASALILLAGTILALTPRQQPVSTADTVNNALLSFPATPENMEKLTLNFLFYSNGLKTTEVIYVGR